MTYYIEDAEHGYLFDRRVWAILKQIQRLGLGGKCVWGGRNLETES